MAAPDKFSSTAFAMALVEAKPLMAAAVAGAASVAIFGYGMQEAIAFGASAALGTSLGDAVLTGAGFETKIQSYLGDSFATFVDPVDFVGAGLGVAAINYSLGLTGSALGMSAAVAALAGGIAPKVSGYILSSLADTKQKGGDSSRP